MRKIVIALLTLLALPIWLWLVVPLVLRLPDDFHYSADVISIDNFYNEATQTYAGGQYSVTSFSYDAVGTEDQGLLINNTFAVTTPTGEPIFSVERLYGIDPMTGKHVSGLGDKDRTGYLFAPHYLREGEPFTYWHINYDGPAEMQYVATEQLYGLTAYHYQTDYDGVNIDQTANLDYLPGVPNERGVTLDPHLELWVEPITGMLLKYQDDTIAYYYDIDTGKRLHPWNHFSNTYSDASVRELVTLASEQKNQSLLFQLYFPAYLILAIGFVFLWALLPANKLKTAFSTAVLIPAAAVLVILRTSLVLVTRFFGYGGLFQFTAPDNILHPLEAILLILLGIGILAFHARLRILTVTLAAVVAVLSTLQLAVLVGFTHFRIELAFNTLGSISSYVAVACLLLAFTLLSLVLPRVEKTAFAQAVASIVMATTLLGFTGALLQALHIATFSFFSQVSLLTLTMLLLASTVLAELGRHVMQPRHPIVYHFASLASLFIPLLVMTLVYSYVEQQITARRHAEFLEAAQAIEQSVTERVNIYGNALYAGAALFSATDAVTDDEWRTFVAATHVLENYPGLGGMEYHMGYEPQLNASLQAALDQARDTGEPTLSGLLQLVQAGTGDAEADFAIYIPIYHADQLHDTVVQRRQAIQGYIRAPFQMQELLAGVLGAERLSIQLDIYDGLLVTSANQLYSSATLFPQAIQPSEPEFQNSDVIVFFGHPWTFQFTSLPTTTTVTANDRVLLSTILWVGIVISILVVGTINTLLSVSRRVNARAAQLTADLSTSRDNAETAKNNSEAILHSIGDGLIVVDKQGVILLTNPAFETMFGWKNEEVLGKKFVDIVIMLDANYQPVPLAKRLLPKVLAANLTETHVQPKQFYRTKTGAIIAVAVTISPVVQHGQVVGAVQVFRDVSAEYELAQKLAVQTKQAQEQVVELASTKAAMLNIMEDIETEKNRTQALAQDLVKFKLALDSTADQVVIVEPQGTIIYANLAVERITGFTVAEVVGKKVGSHDLWGGLMDQRFYQTLWHTVKDERKVFSGEMHNHRKDGTDYYAFANIAPIIDEDGNIKYFVMIERDITEAKKIDKAKSEFVSLASHQLRTPLSTINWYSEMLLAEDAGPLNKEQLEYLNEIYTGNQRMVDLVNALLNVSRIELGTFSVEPEMVDLVTLAKEVVKDVESLIFKRQLGLDERYKPESIMMNLDPKLTRIIIENLLTNAIKYTPERGQVNFAIVQQPEGVLISVQDTGFGIPKEQQGKIFTKLFRADNVKAKDTVGTGLGLYLTKAIVEYSGGKIWFESVEDKGTTFFIQLPARGMPVKTGTRRID